MPEMENMKSEITSRAQNMPGCNNQFQDGTGQVDINV